MEIFEVKNAKERRRYYKVAKEVYKNYPKHRSTENEIARNFIEKKTVFLDRADIFSFIITENGADAGCFSLIMDKEAPNLVQVAFCDFKKNLTGLKDLLKKTAKEYFPRARTMVIGLHGHLNYGAGFLTDNFEEEPVFGLPYTPAYYLDYFKDSRPQQMVSYRVPVDSFIDGRFNDLSERLGKDITIRKMSFKNLEEDIGLYTSLNNRCFQNHIYWTDRKQEEDYELFHPFRFFLKEENLLFAYHMDKPVGFLLWYPDFNQLAGHGEALGLKHLLKYKFGGKIDSARFTEIAVLKEYESKPVGLVLIAALLREIKKAGYKYWEGGFIFEENVNSINLVLRFASRMMKKQIEPHRRYVVFEEDL